MNCLTPEELIALLYRETDPDSIRAGRKHLQDCASCAERYWELHDTRFWVHQQDHLEKTADTVLIPQPRGWRGRIASVAAGFCLIAALGWTGFRTQQLEQQLVRIQTENQQVENWIQRAENRLDESNRNQYMLMLGLKDYMDQNFMQRRVSYETYQ